MKKITPFALACASISVFGLSACGNSTSTSVSSVSPPSQASSTSPATSIAPIPTTSHAATPKPTNTGIVKMSGGNSPSSGTTAPTGAATSSTSGSSATDQSHKTGTTSGSGDSSSTHTSTGSRSSDGSGNSMSAGATAGSNGSRHGSTTISHGASSATSTSTNNQNSTPGHTGRGTTGSSGSVSSHSGSSHSATSHPSSSTHHTGTGGHTVVATHGSRTGGSRRSGSSSNGSGTTAPKPNPSLSSPNPKLGPNRVSIPSLGINLPLTSVGVSGGQMAVPNNYSQLGRWTGSAPIGASNGRVVIDGHIWGPLGKIAGMRTGTVVYISDGSGTTYRFIARSKYEINKHALSYDTFYGTGPMQVSLITCGGRVRYYASDNMLRHDDNVVVTLTRG